VLIREDRRHLNTSSDSEVLLNVFASELQRVGDAARIRGRHLCSGQRRLPARSRWLCGGRRWCSATASSVSAIRTASGRS
jgi:hypothetical protein